MKKVINKEKRSKILTGCFLQSKIQQLMGFFPNLANGKTFQFMFLKDLIEYQNIKMKPKFKSDKSRTTNIKAT